MLQKSRISPKNSFSSQVKNFVKGASVGFGVGPVQSALWEIGNSNLSTLSGSCNQGVCCNVLVYLANFLTEQCFSRFLLVLVACLLTLIGKGLALAPIGVCFYGLKCDRWLGPKVIAITVATTFLPGLVLGIISCWHRGIFKSFLAHPSIILMPTFTFFTFASSTKRCKGCKSEEVERQEMATTYEEEPYITFSAKWTAANILLSTAGYFVFGSTMAHMSWKNYKGIPRNLVYYLYEPDYHIPFIAIPILGILLTLLFLVLISSNLCSIQYGALVPSLPHSPFSLGFDRNNQPRILPEEEETRFQEEATVVLPIVARANTVEMKQGLEKEENTGDKDLHSLEKITNILQVTRL